MGRSIHDPDRVESETARVDGLGLLDAETVFAGDKRTVRVTGELLAGGERPDAAASAGPHGAGLLGSAGTPLSGYEIHMGRTALGPGATPLLRLRAVGGDSAHEDGAVSFELPVCGSYVHGLFDEPVLRAGFLNRLRAARGLPSRPSAPPPVHDDIDRLADHVEAHLDTQLLERIAGLEER
jgi:adenosylcobyric acid synthase